MNVHNEVGNNLNSTNSSENSDEVSERRLKIDPNYKWLLKDLNLNNNKRVIDVTAILDENDNSKMSQIEDDNSKEYENSELEEGEILKETHIDNDNDEYDDDEEQKQEYNTSDSDNDSYDEQKKYMNENDEDESEKTSSKSSRSKSSRTSSDIHVSNCFS
jgi:hypothetical protein